MQRKNEFQVGDRVVIIETGKRGVISEWIPLGGKIKARIRIENQGGLRHHSKDEIKRIN